MSTAESSLDLALQQLERISSNQLLSIDGLATKASVGVGLVLAAFGGIFSLGRAELHQNLFASLLSASFLTASAFVLLTSYMMREFHDPPHPYGLLRLVNQPIERLKKQLIANLADAYMENKQLIVRQFRYMNSGFVLFALGVVTFIFGVLLYG